MAMSLESMRRKSLRRELRKADAKPTAGCVRLRERQARQSMAGHLGAVLKRCYTVFPAHQQADWRRDDVGGARLPGQLLEVRRQCRQLGLAKINQSSLNVALPLLARNQRTHFSGGRYVERAFETNDQDRAMTVHNDGRAIPDNVSHAAALDEPELLGSEDGSRFVA